MSGTQLEPEKTWKSGKDQTPCEWLVFVLPYLERLQSLDVTVSVLTQCKNMDGLDLIPERKAETSRGTLRISIKCQSFSYQ